MIKSWFVIPCYNEADRLESRRIIEWCAGAPTFGLWMVNDGSSDDTAAVLNKLVLQLGEQGRVLHLPQNAGKAEAVRQGLLNALALSPAVIGYIDADLATPLEELFALTAALDADPDCDIAMGARVRLLGRQIQRRAYRHYLGRVFAAAASMTLRLPVYDTQCGAKAFRVGSWIQPILAEPFGSRWAFDVELLARYLLHRHERAGSTSITEVPLRHWRDVGGSKVRPRDFFVALHDLWRIYRKYQPQHLNYHG